MNSDGTNYYNNLETNKHIETADVKVLQPVFEIAVSRDNVEYSADYFPKEANGLALRLGDAFIEEGKEFCKVSAVVIKQ